MKTSEMDILGFTRTCADYDKSMARFFSHETNRQKLEQIFRHGLNPNKMERGLLYLDGKYVMFSSVYKLMFEEISRSSAGRGSPNSVYIVFTKEGDEKHILDELLSTEKGRQVISDKGSNWVERIVDWYISYEPINPDRFIRIYDNNGMVIWDKRNRWR